MIAPPGPTDVRLSRKSTCGSTSTVAQSSLMSSKSRSLPTMFEGTRSTWTAEWNRTCKADTSTSTQRQADCSAKSLASRKRGTSEVKGKGAMQTYFAWQPPHALRQGTTMCRATTGNTCSHITTPQSAMSEVVKPMQSNTCRFPRQAPNGRANQSRTISSQTALGFYVRLQDTTYRALQSHHQTLLPQHHGGFSLRCTQTFSIEGAS